jgi:aminoglycoside phosphotransferase (APT) family kinase protein
MLREGQIDPAFAGEVGAAIAKVHSGTAARPDIRERFGSERNFRDLRVRPYFEASGLKNPELRDRLHAIGESCVQHAIALVHGDVSPKNILCGPRGPVFLDAECAVYADPAFDPAFCLTHLLLKCVWRPQHAARLHASFRELWLRYAGGADWEGVDGLERRVSPLVCALLLARVDGKSPVEYLGEIERAAVRAFSRRSLLAGPFSLEELLQQWDRHTK